ncbi:MAG: hypothetical protein DHS20C17_23640 [Cyclobacteriaceae bacterium]|nr:MAG: hypothetical protein DHS20C17_23640 [Cyclobacteriaceae bacterium]
MKKIDITLITLVWLLVISCQPGNDPNDPNDPQRIIDKVIENHGGTRYDNFYASFDFRDRHYTIERKNGIFQYERHFSDPSGEIKDVLNNDGFSRYLNEHDITDTVARVAAYARSVNSVVYFAILPYPLNDPAVNKTYLGTEEIKGQPYHKILVTFEANGGGEDHSDEFVYWIHRTNYTMDYLAYLYFTEGGGKRFRAPMKVHDVGGLRFYDYENYKGTGDETAIEDYGQLYDQGKLELLSKIELKNLEVR